MKKWTEKIAGKMRQWAQGRYGNDELNTAAYILSVVLLLLSCFERLRLLIFPAFALMIWTCFRCWSRNLYKRGAEREKYMKFTGGIRSWFRLQKDKWRDRKTYRYFRCSSCGTVMRVPRGKGKITIHCPKCRSDRTAKT